MSSNRKTSSKTRVPSGAGGGLHGKGEGVGAVRRSWRWWSWVAVLAFWLSCVVEVVMLVGLAWLDARAGAGRTAVVVTAVPVGRAVAGPAEEGEEA